MSLDVSFSPTELSNFSLPTNQKEASFQFMVSWFKKSIVFDLKGSINFKDLYNSYEKWCFEKGVIPDSSALFARMLRKYLKEQLFSHQIKVINNKGIVYKGIKLNQK